MGCRPGQVGGPARPKEPTPAYVDLSRIVPLHPAIREYRSLVEAHRTPRRTGETADAAGTAFDAPPEARLPAPRPPASAPPPYLGIDTRRTNAELTEEGTVRRLAEPDRAEEAYEATLRRLRKEYAELRQPAEVRDPSEDLRRGSEQAEREKRLTEHLAGLRERPEDRFFYSSAQLRRRRELYAAVQAELQELRAAQVDRLKQALELPRRTVVPVPERRLREAQVERDRERARARRALELREREERQAAAQIRLPAPIPAETPPIEGAPDPEVAAVRAEIARLVGRPEPGRKGAGGPPPPSGSPRAASAAARSLYRAMLEDVKAAAVRAGMERGYAVQFVPGCAPDRTRELLGIVRRELGGREWGVR